VACFDTVINFKKEAAMAKPSQNHAQKLSKFVKQNSVGRSAGAKIRHKKNWQRVITASILQNVFA